MAFYDGLDQLLHHRLDPAQDGDKNLHSLLCDCYALLCENWKRNRGDPGQENWRVEQIPTLNSIGPAQASEVCLERAIVRALDGQEKWYNQIPTCSGYCSGRNRRCAIDLGHFSKQDRSCTFIELKTESNSPLEAAVELVKYYCANYFTRRNRHWCFRNKPKSCPWLDAEEVKLQVLAPAKYYAEHPGSLYRLQKNIEDALNQNGDERLPKRVIFRFKMFPEWFYPTKESWCKWLWKEDAGDAGQQFVLNPDAKLLEAIAEIVDVG